jgi:hypothetical protein
VSLSPPPPENPTERRMVQISVLHLALAVIVAIGGACGIIATWGFQQSLRLQLLEAAVMALERRFDARVNVIDNKNEFYDSVVKERGEAFNNAVQRITRIEQEVADMQRQLDSERRRK